MIEEGTQVTEGATGNIEGIDAEALMSTIESGGQVQPQTPQTPPAQPGEAQPPAAASATDPSQPQTPPAAPWEKDTLKINGQEFTATRDQILKWAAQGRNYPQLVEKLNQEKQQLQTQYKTYAEIESFAKANPEWWSGIVQSYQQQTSQTPATAQVPPELKAEIDQLKEFKSNFETEQAQKTLDAEVQGIRKEYPDLPWDVLDESGQSLEMRVYDHAVKNGIQSFQTAFRDLMHTHLVKYHADKARADAVKELQAKRKQGLVGVSTQPQHQAPAGPRKFAGYDDAAQAALAELGIQTG